MARIEGGWPASATHLRAFRGGRRRPCHTDDVVGPGVLERSGSWAVSIVEGADVRLRSGRVGLVTVDVKAPIVSGTCTLDDDSLRLELSIALDRLRTRSPILQAAARMLITRHHATRLSFVGTGKPCAPWHVCGTAQAGDVEVPLTLSITRLPADAAEHLELTGTAQVGTVHLPLPGLGTVEDFAFDVDARVRVHAT